ncbi:uncharacterized protein APUU_50514S [Aspergillus puulaauensis]|uniref:Uncharacterized protein n=1 Tax=Aspergillus puulaauensis TaxID=1220207 RepID=A0A7R7XRV4_9EURO|nr:uncharacterized protein APUU_50514S [Aspergillus puulaauensis]BCS25803.1 hypothetical protein APUU_50514S [Aspergillus puulaauensis]
MVGSRTELAPGLTLRRSSQLGGIAIVFLPVSSVRTVRQIPTHRSSQFRATITQWHIFFGLSSESFPPLLHLQSLPLLSLFSPSFLILPIHTPFPLSFSLLVFIFIYSFLF